MKLLLWLALAAIAGVVVAARESRVLMISKSERELKEAGRYLKATPTKHPTKKPTTLNPPPPPPIQTAQPTQRPTPATGTPALPPNSGPDDPNIPGDQGEDDDSILGLIFGILGGLAAAGGLGYAYYKWKKSQSASLLPIDASEEKMAKERSLEIEDNPASSSRGSPTSSSRGSPRNTSRSSAESSASGKLSVSSNPKYSQESKPEEAAAGSGKRKTLAKLGGFIFGSYAGTRDKIDKLYGPHYAGKNTREAASSNDQA